MNTITVNIDKLKLDWFIGIYDYEYETAQPVVIDITMETIAPKFDGNENYDDVVCYKTIVDEIKDLSKQGHIALVETLANKLCDLCLTREKVMSAEVSVKKISAIDETDSVGVKLKKVK